jgi:uncharacterized protein YqeY
MSLKKQINEQLKEAMRAKDNDALTALRQLKTEIMKVETSGSATEASDEEILTIVKSLVKQHKESIEAFEQAGRTESAESEKKELELLQAFLPREATLEELEPIVDLTISATGASSIKEMGKVMKGVNEALKGSGISADGKLLSEIVKQKLG